ncbi:ATP-binding protein [Clostridium amazonitimonense]|uniref:ATP-binding protein n=1 Tax=Clostridium amazonitimonense TaxID=1499689 RepID=UPI000509A832|nr:AAA family ATPase [Clostridium amazonitimonense]
MIIKKLNIISFGKFKNKTIELKDGINIIYGKNEAGKSTIQGFIKAMLYGMNSQKKAIRENERKRYMPWSGEKMQGELIYEETDGNEYIIKRSFGNTRKEDQGEIIHCITGEKIRAINVIEPGKEILGLNEEGFNKTLFIKQLGLEIKRGKGDEILEKLTNLVEVEGEEGSYEKAIKVLEEAKRFITTPRKTGKLDGLKLELEELNREYSDSVRLSKEGIEEQLELNKLQEKKIELGAHINKLELYKKHIKRIKLHKEYKEILEYLKKSDELNREKEKVEEDLLSDKGIIDKNFIDSLKEEYRGYNQLKDIYIEREESKNQVEESLKTKKEEFYKYEKFNNLDEEVERKVISLCLEKKNIEERIKEIQDIEKELSTLECNLKTLKDKYEVLEPILDFRGRIEGIFYDYENKLKELKYKMDNSNIDYKLIDEKHVYEKNKRNNLIFSICSFITIPFIFAIKFFKAYEGYLIFPLIFVLMCLTLFFIKRERKNSKALSNIHKEILKDKEVLSLNETIASIEKDLEQYYKASGAKDYKDFLIKLRNLEDIKENIDKLKVKIEEKLIQKENYQPEVLKENLQNINKYLQFILEHTESQDIEEFLMKNKEFKLLNNQIVILNSELNNILKSIDHINEEIEIKERNIKEKIMRVSKGNISIEVVSEEIERLEEKLKEKQDIENRLKNIDSSYRLLLKDRDLEKMREEIGDILKEDIEENFKDEEMLDEALKEKNKELLNTEKRLKDVENSIENKFIGKRRITDIEENMESVKNEISELEYRLQCINIAYETLIECFKELQRDFGPLLNNKVSKILCSITMNNYNEVKVSEEYSIKLRDNNENTIVDAEYLSNGTLDQIYFALRMAFVDLIFNQNESVPIFLDEAFMQYDDDRLMKVLDYIQSIESNRQIIIFTCQRREIDIIKQDSNIIYI